MSIPQLPDVAAEAPKRKGSPQIPIPQAWKEGSSHAPQAGAQEQVLFWCTLVAILVSMVFWSGWWSRIWPLNGFFNAVMIGGMALLCALAMPLMLSSLIPSTPLGYLLLKNRLRGPGYAFLIVCLIGFLVFAWTVAQGFAMSGLASAEGITPENQLQLARTTALVMLVLFVGIPAWAWVQASPEKMVQQAWQDHQVKKMEVAFQIELEQLKAQRDQLRKHHANQLAVLQATYIQALRRLRLPLEEATAQRFGEVAGILASLGKHEQDVLGKLVLTVDDLVGSRALVPQIEMLNGRAPDYEELRLALTTAVNTRLQLSQPQAAPTHQERQQPPAPPQPPTGGSSMDDTAYQPPPQQSTVDHSGRPQLAIDDLRAMEQMQAAFPDTLWKRQDVQTVCKVQHAKANRLINVWVDAGYAEALDDPKWTYRWTGDSQ